MLVTDAERRLRVAVLADALQQGRDDLGVVLELDVVTATAADVDATGHDRGALQEGRTAHGQVAIDVEHAGEERVRATVHEHVATHRDDSVAAQGPTGRELGITRDDDEAVRGQHVRDAGLGIDRADVGHGHELGPLDAEHGLGGHAELGQRHDAAFGLGLAGLDTARALGTGDGRVTTQAGASAEEHLRGVGRAQGGGRRRADGQAADLGTPQAACQAHVHALAQRKIGIGLLEDLAEAGQVPDGASGTHATLGADVRRVAGGGPDAITVGVAELLAIVVLAVAVAVAEGLTGSTARDRVAAPDAGRQHERADEPDLGRLALDVVGRVVVGQLELFLRVHRGHVLEDLLLLQLAERLAIALAGRGLAGLTAHRLLLDLADETRGHLLHGCLLVSGAHTRRQALRLEAGDRLGRLTAVPGHRIHEARLSNLFGLTIGGELELRHGVEGLHAIGRRQHDARHDEGRQQCPDDHDTALGVGAGHRRDGLLRARVGLIETVEHGPTPGTFQSTPTQPSNCEDSFDWPVGDHEEKPTFSEVFTARSVPVRTNGAGRDRRTTQNETRRRPPRESRQPVGRRREVLHEDDGGQPQRR